MPLRNTVLIILLFFEFNYAKVDSEEYQYGEESAEYWFREAQEELQKALKLQNLNRNVAKNVIIFIGDGMGITTITAGRILKGQKFGDRGEESKLAMETLPHVGLSKTYTLNRQVPDSAATVTAMLSGVKAKDKTIGLNGYAKAGDCSSQYGNEVTSIIDDFYAKGKATGVVTTTHITHATPAGAYAHSVDRNWVWNGKLPKDAVNQGCRDIAQQFMDHSDKIKVALGGGRKYFRDRRFLDEEYPTDVSSRGVRTDGQNLILNWMGKSSENDRRKFVWRKKEFDETESDSIDKLLGLFEPNDMKYDHERYKDGGGEPTLREMTKKAITILQKETNGYFLLVEGGKIDHGHHENSAYKALHELVAFDEAVEEAISLTSQNDTLLVVTADHSHVITMGGNSVRGNPIFGLAPSNENPEVLVDKKPYTTLLYANGMGYQGYESYRNLTRKIFHVERQDLSRTRIDGPNYRQQTAAPRSKETHGGEDVAIFASGPMAHLFHGVHEQNYIGFVIRYAACVGKDLSHCNISRERRPKAPNIDQIGSSGDSTNNDVTQTKLTGRIGDIVNQEKMVMKKDTKNESIMFLGKKLTPASASYTMRIEFVFIILLSILCAVLCFMLFYNQKCIFHRNTKLVYPL